MNNLVKTSYSKEDAEILLQDIKGRVEILDTEEREKLNQQGVHYSEMLPLEYKPTEEYIKIYGKALEELSLETANAVAILSEKLVDKFNSKEFVIVSLARAGTPIGILVKRYIKFKYNIEIPHYSISIIRGKGFDKAAINYIVDRHGSEKLQFLDGWVGKGAINKVLEDACKELAMADIKFEGLDSELAVLSDPASVTELYGTTQDFLIPSACLNATVSGLVSRTVHMPGMSDAEFHGAVYYEEYEAEDKSVEFIDTVCKYFGEVDVNYFDGVKVDKSYKGIEEVTDIANKFGIDDINKVKPGVGETTRVLLRRLPDRVLIRPDADPKYTQHIIRLCEEKGVPLEEYPLIKYNTCGIIKEISDL